MTRKILGAVALFAGMSGVAMAGHCPMDAKAIDHAMMSMALDAKTKAQVQALRDEGMKLHESGNHRDSEKKLAEAMRMLLMAK